MDRLADSAPERAAEEAQRAPAAAVANLHAIASAGRARPDLVRQAQALIGNRAVGRMLARVVKTIRGEDVDVADDKEEKEADAIMGRLTSDYGVAIDSGKLVAAVKDRYSFAPADELKKVDKRRWLVRELRALERACSHFAPIMGSKRAKSSRSGSGQEVTVAGKATVSIDPVTKQSDSSVGEYFSKSTAFGMFRGGETYSSVMGDVDKEMEMTATHEMAHGLLDYAVPDFVAKMDFWTTRTLKSGKKGAEEPPTSYGKKNAAEDFCDSVGLFFIKPASLKASSPQRHAFIEKLVADWTPATPAPTKRDADAAAGPAPVPVGS